MTKKPSRRAIAGLSKYTAPASTHWLKRERLFTTLDRMVVSPVVWVNAPAGCGKTVLIASYLSERGRPTLWYRTDDRDTDPGAFFHRLREAACQGGLRDAERLPALTGEYAGGEKAFARNFFEALCAGAPDGFALVFDDFQQLPDNAPLQTLMEAVFDSIPPSCTLFVLSRHSPPPRAARLRANRHMGVLGEAELRLSEAETAALVAAWPGIPDAAVSAEALHQRMQGWAAGVVLTLEFYGQELLFAPPAPDVDVIFDYFASEVVAALEAPEREFLLATALPTQFDETLARALSGNSDAAEILRALLRRNFFVYQENTSYRYHPLFRDFLLRTLEREWPAEQTQQRRLHAASLLLERSEPDMALPLLRDAADWQRFVEVLMGLAPIMMGQGRHRELARWLQSIPKNLAAESPWLDYWAATCRLPTDYFTSYELYRRAYARFDECGEGLGAVLAWIGAVDAIIFSLSEVSRLDIWLAQLAPLLSKHVSTADEDVMGQLASRVTSILTLRQPEHTDLGRWRGIAEQAVARMADPNQRTLSSFYLCTYNIWRGDLEEAAVLLGRNIKAADEMLPPLAATTKGLAQAWLDWTSGRGEACRSAVSRGLELAEESGVHVWTVILWMQGVTNALLQGDVAEADGYFARLEPYMAHMRDMDAAYYFIDRAWAELLRGDTTQALTYQRRALHAAEHFGAVYTRAEAHFGMAQVSHELGDAALAGEHLRQAQALGEQFGSWTMSFQCMLAQAQFALDAGERDTALVPLRAALERLHRHGVVIFNGWRPAVIARLCALALEHDIQPDLVRNLISHFRLEPPKNEPCDGWPWPVNIQTLGRFALEVDGLPVDLTGGKHGRPCALLKQLIAAEPHGIAESHLAEILWPDADGDVAMRNLRTNLHRLRKLLGHDTAILVVQGRASINPRICRSDVQTLGRLLHAAQRAPAADLPRLADRLLSIEPGSFLPDEEGELIVKYRARLAGRLHSTLQLVADRLRESGHAVLADALAPRN